MPLGQGTGSAAGSAQDEPCGQRLQLDHPVPAKGLTKAGIRKMIARLHEELAVYEGSQEVKIPGTMS